MNKTYGPSYPTLATLKSFAKANGCTGKKTGFGNEYCIAPVLWDDVARCYNRNQMENESCYTDDIFDALATVSLFGRIG